jgi:protein phosphatase
VLRVADSWRDSDTGRQRRVNEDSFFARAPLFAVADGMGGAQAGEVASREAVQVLEHGLPDGRESAEERLAGLVKEANRRIHELSRSDDERAGMGTTLTTAYVTEEDLAVAHVGDSRLYCLRAGELQRLTRDHSLVEELVQEGKLTPEEADEHPQRSIITRALGPEPDVIVDHMTWQARPGDVYLLCSDGLTSMVAEARVGDVLRAAPSLRDAGRALIDAANAAGGRDNITVVLFSVEEVRSALATQDAPATATHVPASTAAPTGRDGTGRASLAARRPPRAPRVEQHHRRRRLGRLAKGVAIALVAITPILLGAWIAVRTVYFVGTDKQGFVTLYQGLPYDLPAGVALYSTRYTSGVPAQTLPPRVRETVGAHKMRSHDDAADLLKEMERGELEAQR